MTAEPTPAPKKEKSWWVQHRDAAEAAISTMFHSGIAFLQPVAQQVAVQAGPAVENALINAGLAVENAVANGAVHGSDDVIDVALKSIRSDAPHLQATVSTALAASVVAAAQRAASQTAYDPGKPQGE